MDLDIVSLNYIWLFLAILTQVEGACNKRTSAKFLFFSDPVR